MGMPVKGRMTFDCCEGGFADEYELYYVEQIGSYYRDGNTNPMVRKDWLQDSDSDKDESL
jgi:hypothetical protein